MKRALAVIAVLTAPIWALPVLIGFVFMDAVRSFERALLK